MASFARRGWRDDGRVLCKLRRASRPLQPVLPGKPTETDSKPLIPLRRRWEAGGLEEVGKK